MCLLATKLMGSCIACIILVSGLLRLPWHAYNFEQKYEWWILGIWVFPVSGCNYGIPFGPGDMNAPKSSPWLGMGMKVQNNAWYIACLNSKRRVVDIEQRGKCCLFLIFPAHFGAYDCLPNILCFWYGTSPWWVSLSLHDCSLASKGSPLKNYSIMLLFLLHMLD